MGQPQFFSHEQPFPRSQHRLPQGRSPVPPTSSGPIYAPISTSSTARPFPEPLNSSFPRGHAHGQWPSDPARARPHYQRTPRQPGYPPLNFQPPPIDARYGFPRGQTSPPQAPLAPQISLRESMASQTQTIRPGFNPSVPGLVERSVALVVPGVARKPIPRINWRWLEIKWWVPGLSGCSLIVRASSRRV